MKHDSKLSYETVGRQRIGLLVVIMVTLSLGIGGATLGFLYNTAFNQFRTQLTDIVKNQAHIIESIITEYGRDKALEHLRSAHEKLSGFGQSGEFTLAEKKGDNISFLLRQRHNDLDTPEPVPMWSKLAEPMRRALSGKTGSVIGIDYRGTTVLAAYEPVKELDWGVVVKIDMAEIRAPFIKIGLIVGGGAILIISAAVFVFFKLSNPLIVEILRTERNSQDEEQKRMELEHIIDHSPVISFLWKNAEGWPVEYVSGSIRTFGYRPEDFYSNRIVFSDIVHPDDLERIAKEIIYFSESGAKNFSQEYRMKMADGSYRWTDDRTWIRRNDKGDITHYQGVVLDISQRKMAEESIRKGELQVKAERDQAQRYLDVSPVMIAVLDDKGVISLINQQGCRLLGYEEGELLNQNWFDQLVSDENREAVFGVFCQLMSGQLEVVEYYENALVTKSGDIREFSFHNSIIQDQQNRIKGILFSAEDITERKKSEEALINANMALKTISKANEALIHAFNEDQLLHDVCRIIVEEGDYRMAWIGLAEIDERRTVTPAASFGYEKGYTNTLDISWSDKTDRGRGPTGEAIRTGNPVICSDILNDKKFLPWKEQALERGYQSSAAFPLLFEGEAIGALNIYSANSHAFDEGNIPLMIELSQDLAYGLKALKNKHIQEANEEMLRWDVAVDTSLMEITRYILQEDIAIDEVAAQILYQVRALTKSQFGFVGYIDPVTGFLVCPTFTRDIWDQCQVENKSAVFEEFTGLFGWVLKNKKSLLTNDPKRDPRSIGVPPGHLPINKFMAVPVILGEELLGEIAVANPDADYGERELYLLERVANYYALAIQQLRSAEKISESELRIRLLMESTGEGIYAVNRQGECTICNPAALAILGYENEDELIGKNMHTLIHHTHTDNSDYLQKDCPVNITIKDGAAVEVIDEVFWKFDKSKINVSYKANPIYQNKEITGAVVSFTDITDRLEAEQKLWQSQKVESIGNLAGGIAHDINNMLLPIQALTDMTLKEIPKDSRAYKRLEKVMDASTQAKNLVSRILTFSRKEDPKKERINLASTIRDVIELLRSTVPSSLKIRIKIQDIGDVMGDASQIHAVLMNLSTNAADAMDGNVGDLTISLAHRKATKEDAHLPAITLGKAYALLRVKDSGHGMDKDTMNRLFDPFFTTKDPGEGTGLGLSIVHGIISKHDGAVRVNSKVGKGTTFELFLPVVD